MGCARTRLLITVPDGIVAGVDNQRIHRERLHMGDAFGEVLKTCHAADGASGIAFELIERSDGT